MNDSIETDIEAILRALDDGGRARQDLAHVSGLLVWLAPFGTDRRRFDRALDEAMVRGLVVRHDTHGYGDVYRKAQAHRGPS
jgi:hypothetical protein